MAAASSATPMYGTQTHVGYPHSVPHPQQHMVHSLSHMAPGVPATSGLPRHRVPHPHSSMMVANQPNQLPQATTTGNRRKASGVYRVYICSCMIYPLASS